MEPKVAKRAPRGPTESAKEPPKEGNGKKGGGSPWGRWPHTLPLQPVRASTRKCIERLSVSPR
eukprot:8986442-Karenia_brevis.AAC.1